MTIFAAPNCYNGSCPEVAPVTLLTNEYTFETSGALAAVIGDVTPASTTKKLLTLGLYDDAGAPVPGDWVFTVRFVDNSARPTEESAMVPDTQPNWGTGVVHSDATGELEMEVEHVGPEHTWYAIVEHGGVAVATAAFTIGTP
ncbi:MAG TPA: hypothetical protein VM238_19570 [Phycisphaerae bacterium]|nr:hypothetical protein [Phycisphaerae bacterium]